MTAPSRAQLWVLALAAAAALVVVSLSRSPKHVQEQATTRTNEAFLERPAASATNARTNTDPKLIAAVAEEVDRRNREARKDRRAFEDDGWTIVESTPPNEAIVDLDPAMLDDHEPELAAQLASTTPPPDRARRVASIAARARDPRTRALAIDALERMGEPGQEALKELNR